ncbi:unnamed protein product, partial [Oppiella nova]
ADECARVSPSGLSALEVVVDFRRESDVRKVIDTTIEAYGQLDVLVNCAGYMVMANIMDPDYIEKQKSMFDVNLNAVILLTQLAVKHLAKTNGNMISISSVGAIKSGLGVSSYSMSKCAINMFTKCMAVELAPKKIRVNAVCLGAIHTPSFESLSNMTRDELKAFKQRLAVKYPIGRIGEPSDVANAVAHLASMSDDEASRMASLTRTLEFSKEGAVYAIKMIEKDRYLVNKFQLGMECVFRHFNNNTTKSI